MVFSSMKKMAFTLVELLVAITIAAILIGVVVAVLRASFETYTYSQGQILLEKALDESLDQVTGNGFENYGIKDALEILHVSPTSITFVPMWVDDTIFSQSGFEDARLVMSTPLLLDPPLRPGASLPIVEVGSSPRRWTGASITFSHGSANGDHIFFNKPIRPSSRIRLIYHPDTSSFPKGIMTIVWTGDSITRTYKGKTETIPRYNIPGVYFSDFYLQYFDNTNSEIEPNDGNISNITAVKVSLIATLISKRGVDAGTRARNEYPVSKTGTTFIGLRNTRPFGAGLLVHQGSRIRIPDTGNIRMFSITNISGARDKGVIELVAKPAKGASWKAVINLALEGDKSIIKSYSIEYPVGNVIRSEVVDLEAGLPLNFMNMGPSSSYGASHASLSGDKINMPGEVELIVERMDATGAMLFVRP